MSKPKVFISEPINPKGIELLEGEVEFIHAPDTTQETAIELIKEADAAILRATTIFDKTVIEAGKNLKIIARTGVGYNNVDLEAASEQGIYVCTTPGTNNSTVAEHTLAMIFALSKQVIHLDKAVRNEQWMERFSPNQMDIEGKTFGLIGLGAIGYAVAQKCTALGMKVIAFDPFFKGQDNFIQLVASVETVFKEADFVSLHCPSTPKTKELVNAKTLALMKPSAYLINTSRGDLVNDADLVAALEAKKIRGAAIDVFLPEPPAADHPFLQLENVIVSPHVAGSTVESNERIATMAAQAVKDVLNGLVPKSIVNEKLLKKSVS